MLILVATDVEKQKSWLMARWRTPARRLDTAGAVAAMQHVVLLLTPLCVHIRVAAVCPCAETQF